MKITTLHVHHYYMYILNLSKACHRERERREKHQIYTFYLKITSPWGVGHEIYKFLSSYPTAIY